jgi:hypothetical protein
VEKAPVTAPGANKISIMPIKVTTDYGIPSRNPLTLSILFRVIMFHYLYIFTGRFTKDQDQLQVIDLDYIDFRRNRDIYGRIVPDWEKATSDRNGTGNLLRYVVNDGYT